MAQFETWIDSDLAKPIKVVHLTGNLFSQDAMSNVIGVNVYNNGVAAALSGTVTGYVVRADGATVLVSGASYVTLSGNKASIKLPQSAYIVPGVISIVVKLTTGSIVTTLGAVTGVVYRTSTDTIVDPGRTIPSLDELLAKIDEMETATTAANTAASAATTAASAIDNMTVAASTLAAGSNATATVSTVSGHKHIAFGIPQGEQGIQGPQGPQGPQGLKGDAGNGDMIADDFSASSAYSAGDYVIYNGSLYRFSADHAAGAWTGTDAAAVQLAEDVTELKSAFNTLSIYGVEIESGYWGVADGKAVANDRWCRTKEILPVDMVIEYPLIGMFLLAYEGDSYIGCWNGSEFSKEYDSTAHYPRLNLLEWGERYPMYSFKIDFWYYGNVITPEDVVTNGSFNRQIKLNNDAIIREVISNDYLNTFIQGGYTRDGNYNANSTTLITTTDFIPEGYETIILNDGFEGTIVGFDENNAFLGFNENDWNLSGGYYGGTFYFSNIIYIGHFQRNFQNVHYKLCVRRTSGTTLTPLQIFNNVILENIKSASREYIGNVSSNIEYAPEINGLISIGHRGGWAAFPENTEVGIIEGVKRGMKYIESDVAYKSDNVPIMLHDLTINRTARNADGSELSSPVYISNITYAQAATYDYGLYKGEEFRGTELLTFDDYIKLCKNLDVVAVIELKRESNNDPDIHTQNRVNNLISVVRKYNMERNVCWISFDYLSLRRVTNTLKNTMCGLAITNAQMSNDTLFNIRCGLIKSFSDQYCKGFATVNITGLTPNILSEFDSRGINIVEFFINSNTDALAIENHASCIGGMTDYALDISEIIKNDILES